MNRIPILLVALCLPFSGSASHGWADYDICRMYQDKLPPGLTLARLPDPASRGAVLLARYCTQCHNLPGPDRHSADEWSEVSERMFMLMDVSSRFGSVLGRVEMIPDPDRAPLLEYLRKNAGDASTAPSGGGIWSPLSRLLVLVPLLLLSVLGLLRWRWRGRKPCATD